MRIAGPKDRLRGASRMAAALAGAAIVAGCSGGSLSSLGGNLPSWFSRSSDSATQAQASVPGTVLDEDCPSVDIRTGAGTLAVTAKSQEPSANDLRYQLTFLELARQCFVNSGTVRMRVGVQGRAISGPAGAPPQLNAPIRYAVASSLPHRPTKQISVTQPKPRDFGTSWMSRLNDEMYAPGNLKFVESNVPSVPMNSPL